MHDADGMRFGRNFNILNYDVVNCHRRPYGRNLYVLHTHPSKIQRIDEMQCQGICISPTKRRFLDTFLRWNTSPGLSYTGGEVLMRHLPLLKCQNKMRHMPPLLTDVRTFFIYITNHACHAGWKKFVRQLGAFHPSSMAFLNRSECIAKLGRNVMSAIAPLVGRQHGVHQLHRAYNKVGNVIQLSKQCLSIHTYTTRV